MSSWGHAPVMFPLMALERAQKRTDHLQFTSMPLSARQKYPPARLLLAVLQTASLDRQVWDLIAITNTHCTYTIHKSMSAVKGIAYYLTEWTGLS